jgi:hypothetical protein
MFRTNLLSIIRSFNTVFTAIGICHTELLKMGKIASVAEHFWYIVLLGLFTSVTGGSWSWVISLVCQRMFRNRC